MPEIKELLGKESLLAIKDYVDTVDSGKEDKENKTTTLSNASTDEQYPSAKLVYNQLQLKSNATNLENGSGTYSLQQKDCTASGNYGSHAEGSETLAFGRASHAEGVVTWSIGNESHSEGTYTISYGSHSHAEGEGDFRENVLTLDTRIGESTTPYVYTFTSRYKPGLLKSLVGRLLFVVNNSNRYSCLKVTNVDTTTTPYEISFEILNGFYDESWSKATAGLGGCAVGTASHSEGICTFAIGERSHAEGMFTFAIGERSHAEGNRTIANYDSQHVSGKYNDNKEATLFEIGNGTADNARSNAFEVYQDGHAEVALMGSTNLSVATKKYVDDKENLIETTWLALKSLRDNRQLVPGRFYRISDYECTTSTENTSSAGHQFDIIVTADSENTLNENARAAISKNEIVQTITWDDGDEVRTFTRDSEADGDYNGEHYFAYKLYVTEQNIQYLYLKSIYSVDTIYNFYNQGGALECHISAATGYDDDYPNINNVVYSYTYFKGKSNLAAWELKYSLDNNNGLYSWAVTQSIVVNSKRYYRNVIYTTDLSKAAPYQWRATDSTASPSVVYTAEDSAWVGGSAYSSREATGNPYRITATYDEGKGVIYWMKDEYNNEATYDFKNILFTKSGSYTNVYTFTKYISDGLIDGSLAPVYTSNSSCSGNKIIQKVVLGMGLPFVVFLFPSSSGQYQWTDNIIDDSAQITLNYRCHYNQIYHSRNITIGGDSTRNYIYSSDHLTLGTSCSQNSFGSVCSYITLGNYCSNNSFDNGCTYINLNSNYCYYNSFGKRCTYINLQSNTSGANDNRLQYVVVHTVQGTSSAYKTITVDRNLPYETNIYAANSKDIILDN